MNNKTISRVHLLNVPLENDYKHTIYFNDKESQVNYFLNKSLHSFDQVSYQRENFKIRIPKHIDKINNCNYVMYQNTFYTDKWYYAFIKSKKYINDNVTEVEIETDSIQTFMFDITIKPSFVEREHVTDDTIGAHTIPEGLETGEYVDQFVSYAELSSFQYINQSYIVIAVSENGLNLTYPSGSKVYGNVFSGLYYLVFEKPSDAEAYIRDIQDEVTEDIIYSIFMIPKDLLDTNAEDFQWFKPEGKNYYMGYVPYGTRAIDIKLAEVTKLNYLDGGYVPRNKKLLTFPYRYLLVSNNAGSTATYNYEDFEGDKCNFSIEGVISPGCAIKLIPYDYKKGKSEFNYTYDNYIESLDAGKLPTCGWINDSYTNWLTQNGVNIGLGIGGGALAVIGGAVTGNMLMVGGGVTAIGSQLTQMYERSLTPNTAKGGVNQGDYNFAKGLCFTPYKKSIREEYARVVDSYFDMFGYKVNKVKLPNKNHRANYWYTKTIDINIDGAIPSEDMKKIKNCYNNGITFWQSNSDIQNYNLTNNIV